MYVKATAKHIWTLIQYNTIHMSFGIPVLNVCELARHVASDGLRTRSVCMLPISYSEHSQDAKPLLSTVRVLSRLIGSHTSNFASISNNKG